MKRNDASPRSAALLLAGLLVAGCSATSPAGDIGRASADGQAPPASGTTKPIRLALEVHRSPGCSCCHEWELYLQAAGWSVRAADDPGIAAFKTQYGLPESTWSCHTAVVSGYVVEGHVPIEAIEDLLATRPDIDGIALPAMPAGSPGMPGVRAGPFEILAVKDGRVSIFGLY